MGGHGLFLLALAATALIAPAQSVQAACTTPSFTKAERAAIPVSNIDQALLSKAVAKQTNYYRCKSGLKPLTYDPALKSAADIHARNMARLNTLSHELPVFGTRTVKQRFGVANVIAKRVRAENIGTEFRLVLASRPYIADDAKNCQYKYYGTGEPIPQHSYGSLAQAMVKRWWQSSGHRDNMLNRKIQRIGAAARFTVSGVAPCGTYYLAQDFAG